MAKREIPSVEPVENIQELPIIETVESNVEETVESNVEEIVEIKKVKGTVVGCKKLNVRKEAKKDSDVVAILDAGTKLTVYLDESLKDFYPIYVKKGDIAGFCMKEYIEVK